MILATLKLSSILRTILMGASAYYAACKIESIWARILGIGFLGSQAVLLLALGIQGEVIPLLLSLACAGAALHAWWYTKM